MYSEVKESGKGRVVFSTGASRDTAEGKGRYDLLPAYAIKRIAQHFENGAKKYADENWRKGIPLRRFLDSAIRHAFNYLEGQRDEDHAAAAAWNILTMIETEEMIRRGLLPESLNNLPDWTAEKEDAQPVPIPFLDEERSIVETVEIVRRFERYCTEDSDRCGCGTGPHSVEQMIDLMAQHCGKTIPPIPDYKSDCDRYHEATAGAVIQVDPAFDPADCDEQSPAPAFDPVQYAADSFRTSDLSQGFEPYTDSVRMPEHKLESGFDYDGDWDIVNNPRIGTPRGQGWFFRIRGEKVTIVAYDGSGETGTFSFSAAKDMIDRLKWSRVEGQT